jgi:hypothetical protein
MKMQFTKPNGYDTAEVLPENGGRARLPKGGYVCRILSVEERESKAGNPYLVLNMDICEGDYMGFFAEDYQSQTGEKKWHFSHRLMIPNDRTKPYTLHLFKTFNTFLEDSNPGWKFDWTQDEKQYRGKLIGVLVNEREYEKSNGKRGMATNIARIVKANTVRSGAYTVPDDELLKTPAASADAGFYVPDNVDDDDLPFA